MSTIYYYFCSICFSKVRESMDLEVLPKLDWDRCWMDFTCVNGKGT